MLQKLLQVRGMKNAPRFISLLQGETDHTTLLQDGRTGRTRILHVLNLQHRNPRFGAQAIAHLQFIQHPRLLLPPVRSLGSGYLHFSLLSLAPTRKLESGPEGVVLNLQQRKVEGIVGA